MKPVWQITRLAIPFAAAMLATAHPAAAHTAAAQTAAAQTAAHRTAEAVALPYTRFTLANGLRVIVHSDHNTPVVAVSVHYAVGSRNEPEGRHGFAHLFEHLMFAGSEHAPANFYTYARDMGATVVNGHTSADSTTFYETVPTGALERTLFLEADRMGHMDGMIDQAMLDLNRDIVRNEKRLNDNQPYGLAYYRAFERLFPAGHPYGHSVIGSMATLDAATVADARDWHRRYYRPANAVLVLAGDVDAETARRLAERYFGALPGGEAATPPAAGIPRLAAPLADVETDQVAQTSVTRYWLTPGSQDVDGPALEAAAQILGTLTGAWLDRALVREGGLATAVVTSSGASAGLGTFLVNYSVAPGVDPARVADRLDRELARFLETGPTQDEIDRIAMRAAGMALQNLETANGRATALGEGELLAGDPNALSRRLQAMAALTPEAVRAAAARWLAGPAYSLTVVPGARPAYAETAPSPAPAATPAVTPSPAATPTAAPALPPIGPATAPRFPAVQRQRLSNGMELVYAHRPGVALTRVLLAFRGGASADAPGEAGAQAQLLSALGRGTTEQDAAALARRREQLAASIWFDVTADQSLGTLTVPSANAAPALRLLAEQLRHPAFAPAEIARAGAERKALRQRQSFDPQQIAERALAPLLYGPDSAYGRTPGEDGPPLTRDRLLALHKAWLRPDKARLFVVSDLPLATVRRLAEQAFGGWRGEGPPGVLQPPAAPQAQPRLVLIDRPNSAQSLILGAVRVDAASPETLFAAAVANSALGGRGGRLNSELRERKGWSYGVGAGFTQRAGAQAWIVSAPVQADRTGEALALLQREIRAFTTNRPISEAEFKEAIARSLAGLPSQYERGDAVIEAMRGNDLLGRADSYPASLPERYRKLTRELLIAAMHATLNPDRLIWVIVGDAASIRQQLAAHAN